MATLEKLPLAATFKVFTSMRARVAWMAHSRPDLSCGINKMAQVAEQAFGPDAVRALNTVIKRAKAGDDLRLMYPALDRSTLRLRVCADASFAGNADLSSQVGYVVLLCDHTGASHILSSCSKTLPVLVQWVIHPPKVRPCPTTGGGGVQNFWPRWACHLLGGDDPPLDGTSVGIAAGWG